MTPMVFFHGLGGSPQGNKSRFLQEKFPHILIPSLSPDLDERLEAAINLVRQPSLIIGSSIGAITALMLAKRQPSLVLALLLLAPAVGYFDPTLVPVEKLRLIRSLTIPGIPTQVIGAIDDELIPLASIEQLVQQAAAPNLVSLVKVQDGHQLIHSFDEILKAVETLLAF